MTRETINEAYERGKAEATAAIDKVELRFQGFFAGAAIIAGVVGGGFLLWNFIHWAAEPDYDKIARLVGQYGGGTINCINGQVWPNNVTVNGIDPEKLSKLCQDSK